MDNYTSIVELFEKKAKLYGSLLENIDQQNKALDAKEEDLEGLQEDWLTLSGEIQQLDEEIAKALAQQELPQGEEIVPLLQELRQKAVSIKQLNDLALQKLKVRHASLKKEMEGVKLGQQTANAYKTVLEAIPTYIDKKS